MKVAVYHNLPSGGAKRALFDIISRLPREWVIDVYTLSTADEEFCNLTAWVNMNRVVQYSPLRLYKSPFGRLNQFQRWRDLLRLDRISRTIANEIDTKGYDVVFVHSCMWTQAPQILNYLETPSLYYCHEPPREIYDPAFQTKSDGWRGALDTVDPMLFLYRSTLKWVDKIATRKADQVLVNSKFMQHVVSQIYGIDLEVCYLGVDTSVFRPLPNIRRENFVLSVGAILPHKGFDFIIKSLSYLPRAKMPMLRLVGNVETPEERKRLYKIASDLNVNIEIEVGISLDSLIQRYNQALVMTYAPYNEPFGLTPLESMACGTPVIGVAEGGVKETIVDGVGGYLVPRDPKLFAKAIDVMISDRQKRNQVGAQAENHIRENWSWEISISRVMSFLQRYGINQ